MPNRYLRAGFVDSKSINALSAEGERMFLRLLIHVDDFGRCEADPDLLLGKLFARQIGRVSESDIKRWIEELCREGVVFLYEANGGLFIQVNKWEQGRAKVSRFPHPPTDENKCFHAYAHENISPDSDSDSDPDSDPDSDTIAVSRSAKRRVSDSGEVLEIYEAYPRKVSKPRALRAIAKAMKRKPPSDLLALTVAYAEAVRAAAIEKQFIPYPATWFNDERFNDSPEEWVNGSDAHLDADPNHARIGG